MPARTRCKSSNARSKRRVAASPSDAVSAKVRRVLTGPTLLAQKPCGGTLPLSEYGQKELRAGHCIAARSLYMEHRTLSYTLKGRGWFGLAAIAELQLLQLVVDVAGETIFQRAKIGAAGLHRCRS